MSNQHVEDLIGSVFGDFTLKELVGEGTFSHVFRALNDRQVEKAIKVPRKYTSHKEQQFDFVPTQVFIKRGQRFSPQEASPLHILKIQIARTRTVFDQGLVRVEDYSFDGENSYCRMPYLSGSTFRDYMTGPVPVMVLRNLALTLSRLKNIDNFGYHGDVKPENLIVTNDGVTLVDCGFFGDGTSRDKSDELQKSLIVTTPRYYPRLVPDDLLAFGLILWETAMRQPLIKSVAYSADYDDEPVSDKLRELVAQEESTGNFNMTGMLGAERPSNVREGLPLDVERILLKAVRLRFDDAGVLDIDSGYKSFEAVAGDLNKLSQSGIHYF